MKKALVVAIAASLFVAAAVSASARISTASDSASLASNSGATLAPKCGAEKAAIAGGFKLAPTNPGSGVVFPWSFGPKQERAWRLGAYSFGGGGVLTAYAYCSAEELTSKSKMITIPAGETRTLSAKCPSSREAVSGGFAPVNAGENPQLLVTSNHRKGTGKWQVTSSYFDVGTGSSIRLRAYVLCSKKPVQGKVDSQLIGNNTNFSPYDLRAKCPAGKSAIANGFDLGPQISKGGPFIRSLRLDGDAARMKVDLYPKTKVKLYAYCR